jgi:hypothetical protein
VCYWKFCFAYLQMMQFAIVNNAGVPHLLRDRKDAYRIRGPFVGIADMQVIKASIAANKDFGLQSEGWNGLLEVARIWMFLYLCIA